MKNSVFIATSLDGYIADKNGKIDWLNTFENTDGGDFGYTEFMNSIDAIVMGRNTYEIVRSFGIDWPYQKHVFVLSTKLRNIPIELKDKLSVLSGDPVGILDKIYKAGYKNLYIDGGKTIQKFLDADLIDEMTITTIPLLLGEGVPLFGKLKKNIKFRCEMSKVFSNGVVQSKYFRDRTQSA